MAELDGDATNDEAQQPNRPFTLPLFDRPFLPTGAATRGQRRGEPSSPLDIVLHIYWSAGLEGHALGSRAAETTNPDEQRALRELQTVEYELKEAAARLLMEVWQLRLPGGGDGENVGERLNPSEAGILIA